MTKLDDMNTEYVLAIDPSFTSTGFAIIDVHTTQPVYIDKFTTSSKHSDDERMNMIITKLFSVVSQYPIKDVVLEDGFLGKNARTCMQLSILRGGIIGTFNFCKYSVNHFLPSQIRMELGVGGQAKKEEVAIAIQEMFKDNPVIQAIGPYSDKKNKDKTSDKYDAVAVGVAYCKMRKRILEELHDETNNTRT